MYLNVWCVMNFKLPEIAKSEVWDFSGPSCLSYCLGNDGPILISSWKCNFSIYLDIQVYNLDIQAITTLLCLL